MDIDALAEFARTRRVGGPPVHLHGSGAHCREASAGDDTGDAARHDIGRWHLTRFCDGRYELLLPVVDESPPGYMWLELDHGPGGCQGIDRLVIIQGYWGSITGDLVLTPGCSPESWSYVAPVLADTPDTNKVWLWLTEADVGAAAFNWRAYAVSAGDPWTSADAVPNEGRAHFAG